MAEPSNQTPRPPATPEFGPVEPGGDAHRYPDAGGARVKKFSVGRFDNNVYVIESAATGEAVIVDGAAEPDRILREVEDLKVTAILQTHTHFDHVGALPELMAALGVPVLVHPDDAGGVRVDTEPLADGDRVTVGNLAIEVLHTPGHTPGGLSFLLGGHLFSGDTLFPAGPGRTTSPEAFAAIMASLERLFALPDGTRVSPGHGLDTTIGRERPYVDVWRERGW